MERTSTIAKSAVALCATLFMAIGLSADSNELPLRKFQNTPVSISTTDQSDENKTNSLRGESAPNRKPYYLRPGDKLRLDLTNPGYDFFNEITIDNQGTANVSLLGWVNLEGKTVAQAEKMLKETYQKEYFKNPRLSLRLLQKAPLRFKILGQVAQPGFYEVPPGLQVDLLDAIAIAGGYTRLANKVTYRYLTQENKDAPVFEKIEIFKIRELKRAPGSTIPILNGDDTIVVGESIF